MLNNVNFTAKASKSPLYHIIACYQHIFAAHEVIPLHSESQFYIILRRSFIEFDVLAFN